VVEERRRIQIGNKQYGRCSIPKHNKYGASLFTINLRQNIPALSSFIIVVIIQKREREDDGYLSSSKQSHIYVICTKQLRWEWEWEWDNETGGGLDAAHAINQNGRKNHIQKSCRDHLNEWGRTDTQ